MTTPDVRQLRLCDVCGQLDDHPRHVTGISPLPDGTANPEAVPTSEFLDALPDGVPARAIAELMDPTTLVRHMDCCAARGCPICQATEKSNGGLRGDALLESILDGAVDHLSDSKPTEA